MKIASCLNSGSDTGCSNHDGVCCACSLFFRDRISDCSSHCCRGQGTRRCLLVIQDSDGHAITYRFVCRFALDCSQKQHEGALSDAKGEVNTVKKAAVSAYCHIHMPIPVPSSSDASLGQLGVRMLMVCGWLMLNDAGCRQGITEAGRHCDCDPILSRLFVNSVVLFVP